MGERLMAPVPSSITVNRLSKVRRGRGERGGSIVELALMAPWIFFLFVGVLDMGFYCYAAICVQSAARIAASQTATQVAGGATPAQLNTLACNAALAEMQRVPNIPGLTGCSALPLQVTRTTLCTSSPYVTFTCDAPDPTTLDWDNASADPTTTAAASQVVVTYQSIPMIPIPGLLTGRLNLSRVAYMRVIVP